MKHETIEQQQEVAYGLPNTAITGKKQALMQVRLDIPSNDQYGGALWVPLYLAPPTSTAIAAMVIKKAAEIVVDRANTPYAKNWDEVAETIRNLLPANAEAELEALMMKVAEEVFNSAGSFLTEDEELRAIVRRVLDEMKGE